MKDLQTDLDVEAEILDDKVVFYQEYEDYVFPEWVRKPMVECATCMASVYGSLIYWPVVFLTHGLFRWSYHPTLAAIFFWVIYCLSLATLNTILG